MSQLPLRSVEAFAAVARGLNLSRAAASLGITVPAVSRRIQILERYLGARLFDRLPRGLALTEAGQRYIAATSASTTCSSSMKPRRRD
jgi:DNA-binding transcriptional LysR family regulator